MSYAINSWDRFVRDVKGIDTYLLWDYLSVLKEKNPNHTQMELERDTWKKTA